jgi:hypothetical protein
VGDDNFVEDGFTYDKSTPESSASWHSFTQFKCLEAPPPPPAPPQKAMATVTGDVDVYNIAQGDEPDEDGVRGVVIGMLRAGQQVELGDPASRMTGAKSSFLNCPVVTALYGDTCSSEQAPQNN